ncbi:MAG: alanine--tRNA ligase [Pseudohongiellaceae bacterium]
MKSADIRRRFLEFFAARGHEIVPSSPLVPANDPTLLFTNSGMVQFKDVFLGRETRTYSRAVTSQRCVRAGGKHNDLENVGYTARHHTFFEMLGNFSFGDYFKREGIRYAWEFLTKELGLPPEKLWVTVFTDDDEAADIWLKEIKVPPTQFSRMGEKDNFWAMGDTGPCGPCSEIFYDHGPSVAGGPPGSPNEDGDRFIEIWNLVFMQFERKPDGSTIKLPKPSVDTGAGLERLAAVLQKVHSNYEIDLFQNLIEDIAKITGIKDLENKSLRVIADHIRSCAFLIIDGIMPANEGRGYVLRRIIRRAVRHGHRLGINDIFFYKLLPPLAKVMGDAYPELKDKGKLVAQVLQEEEQQFARTLEHGMAILDKAIHSLGKDKKNKVLPGETVFKLYDTYGFPADLTADVVREHGFELDMDGFEAAMAGQREQARAASNFAAAGEIDLGTADATRFTGYGNTEDESKVSALFNLEGQPVNEANSGEEVLVLLDSSPFYGESGGQVGDTGELLGASDSGSDTMLLKVLDTQKQGDVLVHRGRLEQGRLAVGDVVVSQVALGERIAITLNHSATHLMHSALRNILGDHVSQKGSLVDAGRLRFDFSHPTPVTPEQLSAIEDMVNEQILLNSEVSKEVMPLEAAKKKGALALFGEKYGDEVRVVSMGGNYSIEFCGGTHVDRTGEIGLFKITSETGISAGVRRIEAVTAKGALALIEREQQTLRAACKLLKATPDDLVEKLRQLGSAHKTLEKELEQLKAKLASSAGKDLASQAEQVKGINLLVAAVDNFNSKALRETVDKLKDQLGSCVIVLASTGADKEASQVSLIAGVSKDLVDKVQAGELVNNVATQLGGKGGGRPDMAMAGATDAGGVDKALAGVKPWLADKL